MKRLKEIKVFPFALFQTIFTTFLGILCGILYAFGGLIIDALVTIGWLSGETMQTPGLSYGTFMAFGALYGFPIIFGVFGFIAGIIEALLFNLIVKSFNYIKK